MAQVLNISKDNKSSFFHAGFLVIVSAFLILSLSPNRGLSAQIQIYNLPMVVGNYAPEFQETRPKINDFLHEHARVGLFKTRTEIYLPYNKILIFSGNIYALRGHNIFTTLAPALQFQKREYLTGFGFTGLVNWPIFQQKSWAIHLNGKISSFRQLTVDLSQRNRWNFEHQLGCSANFTLNEAVQISLNAYQYRIIEDIQYDNLNQSYINSSGGFATLQFQF
ncbi:hypothetical protein MNBD_ALPHA03-60 [hydrothermal vent metagenome]|uniref:Uncharacterized protein n=1 Tax=hydrothermal vent metagenome TaxID=652676 RepID=A0A3B1ADM3_9ZZZZ